MNTKLAHFLVNFGFGFYAVFIFAIPPLHAQPINVVYHTVAQVCSSNGAIIKGNQQISYLKSNQTIKADVKDCPVLYNADNRNNFWIVLTTKPDSTAFYLKYRVKNESFRVVVQPNSSITVPLDSEIQVGTIVPFR